MLNIIKAEFIKLKKIKSLNIAFWFVLLSSTAVMALIFWGIASQWVVSGFFANAFRMEDMMKVFLGWLFVYIFCFSFITDSLVFVDKGKWWLLYSKNIRAKYFWAKYFWVCVICFITHLFWYHFCWLFRRTFTIFKYFFDIFCYNFTYFACFYFYGSFWDSCNYSWCCNIFYAFVFYVLSSK